MQGLVVAVSMLLLIAVAVGLFLRARGRADWAPFFSASEGAAFEQMVGRYFAAKRIAVEVSDGSVRPAPGGELPGGMSACGLQNLAQSCHRAARSEWPRIIREHFGSLARDADLSRQLERDMGDFEKIRPLLAVRLYPAGALPESAELIQRTDLEGTVSVIVLDLPSTTRSLKPSEAEPWGRADEELFAIGLENVIRGAALELRPVEVADDLRILMIADESFYVATRVLELAALPGAVGTHGSLVAIPNRHTLIVHPIEDMAVVGAVNVMLPIATKMEAEGPGSITPKVYWARDGAFMDVPYRVQGKRLEVMPPPEFTDLLNGLASASGHGAT